MLSTFTFHSPQRHRAKTKSHREVAHSTAPSTSSGFLPQQFNTGIAGDPGFALRAQAKTPAGCGTEKKDVKKPNPNILGLGLGYPKFDPKMLYEIPKLIAEIFWDIPKVIWDISCWGPPRDIKKSRNPYILCSFKDDPQPIPTSCISILRCDPQDFWGYPQLIPGMFWGYPRKPKPKFCF
jgi:hypothetical protein